MFSIFTKVKFFDRFIYKKSIDNTLKFMGILGTFFSWLITNIYITCAIAITLYLYFHTQIFISSKISKKCSFRFINNKIIIENKDFLSSEIINNHSLIKIFSFNEYFDTNVDENIISSKSLNGKIINHGIIDNQELDIKLKECTPPVGENSKRLSGRKKKYKLGTICKYSKDIFLTSLSKFDKDNRAYLSNEDFMSFLMNFWDELDKKYSNKSIAIPLFGSGLTRFTDRQNCSPEYLLKIILFSLYLSNFRPSNESNIYLLMDSETSKKINFNKIKEWFNELLQK